MKKKGLRRSERYVADDSEGRFDESDLVFHSLETEIYYLPASVSQSSRQWEIGQSAPSLIFSDLSPSRSVQVRRVHALSIDN